MSAEAPTDKLEAEQHTAARVAGVFYLLMMVTGVSAEFYFRARLNLTGDVVHNAANFAVSERLFRIGTITDLITFAGDVVLVLALYIVLKPINKNLALLALCWRLIECAINAVIMLNDFIALHLMSGVDYLRVFNARQLQALARFFIVTQGEGFLIGFVFFGLGSAVFSYLWLKSRYIPRLLAAWGIFSGAVVGVATLFVMVFPDWADTVSPLYFMPVFIFELTIGFWLIFKGIRHQSRNSAVE